MNNTRISLLFIFSSVSINIPPELISIVLALYFALSAGNIVYFNCPSWHYEVKSGEYNDYVCVDGLQRLTAICKFINNEIKVFGSYFKEYEDPRGVNQHTLIVNVNDLKTEKEVLQWYIDMNAGGTPHTKDEIERVKRMLESLE